MSVYQDRIQGTDRLLRVRRMKKVVYAVLAGLSILLLYARLQAEGAAFKPLFLPVNGILEIGLMMGFVALLLGFYFRNLEINGAQRESQKYLMARFSMGRAGTTAGLTLVLAVLLLLPMAASAAGSAFTQPPRSIAIAGLSTEVVTFASPDPLGVSFVAYVRVTATSGRVNVTLMRNNATVSATELATSQSATLPAEPRGWTTLAEWSLSIRNLGNGGAIVSVVLDMAVLPTLFSTVPFLLLVCGAANVGWWMRLRPVRDRAKSAAVYAGGAAEIGGGERAYMEYAANPAPQAWPTSAAVEAPPPPPPSAAPPPPPPAPAVAVSRPEVPPVRAPTRDTPESVTAKADALMAATAYPAALVAYEEALRLNANHVPALAGRANALLGLHRDAEAFDVYKRVLALKADHEAALRGSATILAGQSRWRECLEAVEGYLRRRPNDPAALELKGDVLSNLGRRPEALAAYEAATALDPRNENVKQKIEEVRVDVPGLLSRALIASASGNYAQALNLFDDILEVEPSNVNALIGKAVAYRRSGKSQEALNCLDLVLRIQPNNAAAFLNRGNLLVERGEFDAALETFDKLVSIFPSDEEAWTAQGDVLVKMGRDDDALRAYAEALKRNPGDEETQRKIHELEDSRNVSADVLQEFYKVKGVGPARAKALIDAGFRSAEDLRKASVDQLLAVRGITRRIAEDLVNHFRRALVEAR